MAVYQAIMAFTNWMWTFPILALLIGGGLVITVACDFVQIKHFGYMLKATVMQRTVRVKKESQAGRRW